MTDQHLTPDALTELRARAAAATPGHWKHAPSAIYGHRVLSGAAPGEPLGGAEWVTRGDAWRAEDAAFIAAANPATITALLNQLEQYRHLLGTHADGHRCTCTMTHPGDHITPPEWEQDEWCPTHPNVDAIAADHAALEAKLAEVRAYADEQAAYGRRGRTVYSACIASDLHSILDAELSTGTTAPRYTQERS